MAKKYPTPKQRSHLMKKIKITKLKYDPKLKVIKTKPFNHLRDFVRDRKGYCLIRVDKKNKQVEVAICKSLNTVTYIVKGTTPQAIYLAIAKRKLIQRHDHFAYLGKELQKAFTALKKNKRYIQDRD